MRSNDRRGGSCKPPIATDNAAEFSSETDIPTYYEQMPGAPTIDIQIIDRPVRYMAVDAFPENAGAECVFLGRTRSDNHEQHGDLVELSYEAYEPMAQAELQRLADQATQQFDCLFIRIHHAIGVVPIAEASVLVQTVCGHRAESFDACRFLIDELKKSVPIWKQERWADGTTWSSGTAVQQ